MARRRRRPCHPTCHGLAPSHPRPDRPPPHPDPAGAHCHGVAPSHPRPDRPPPHPDPAGVPGLRGLPYTVGRRTPPPVTVASNALHSPTTTRPAPPVIIPTRPWPDPLVAMPTLTPSHALVARDGTRRCAAVMMGGAARPRCCHGRGRRPGGCHGQLASPLWPTVAAVATVLARRGMGCSCAGGSTPGDCFAGRSGDGGAAPASLFTCLPARLVHPPHTGATAAAAMGCTTVSDGGEGGGLLRCPHRVAAVATVALAVYSRAVWLWATPGAAARPCGTEKGGEGRETVGEAEDGWDRPWEGRGGGARSGRKGDGALMGLGLWGQ